MQSGQNHWLVFMPIHKLGSSLISREDSATRPYSYHNRSLILCCLLTLDPHSELCMHIYISRYACVYVYIYICICIWMYMYIYICINIDVYIYICICIYRERVAVAVRFFWIILLLILHNTYGLYFRLCSSLALSSWSSNDCVFYFESGRLWECTFVEEWL